MEIRPNRNPTKCENFTKWKFCQAKIRLNKIDYIEFRLTKNLIKIKHTIQLNRNSQIFLKKEINTYIHTCSIKYQKKKFVYFYMDLKFAHSTTSIKFCRVNLSTKNCKMQTNVNCEEIVKRNFAPAIFKLEREILRYYRISTETGETTKNNFAPSTQCVVNYSIK